jgi:hypothetical protein
VVQFMKDIWFRFRILQVFTNTYICNNVLNSGCDLILGEKKLIWDYQKDLVNPVMQLKFNCTNMPGNRISKTKINWNTNILSVLSNERFEMLKKRHAL